MTLSKTAGTTFRVLCLPILLQLLCSCGHPAQQPKKPTEAEEFQQDIEAIKNHPSLRPGSNEAGAPLHFDPYPKPKPPGVGDDHDHHHMAKR